jgi:bifunctional N-acetylglucosamine-1-phosphate-uridyltransferase/glucosamine-1-phosphate-acetyltransferase GlmU-like protein
MNAIRASFIQDLKIAILAGGRESDVRDQLPILLQNLGEQKVVDYVVRNALEFATPDNLYIIVGIQQDEMRHHLGAGYQYINQDTQLGTGHAVLQLEPLMEGFNGNLLILYGDTPLFRLDSIRGLLNRHQLRQADLTIMTAIVDKKYPYGRIIRDGSGNIIDIIEAAQATKPVLDIRELNVGAYLVRSEAIFPVIKKLAPSPIDNTYRLTDCVHELIRSGKVVESYQIYDPDEVHGINTTDDLKYAEFILQKRLFQPHHPMGEGKVTFGTGGWRAIIGESLLFITYANYHRPLANMITRNGMERHGVLIGFDRRFLSDRWLEAASEILPGIIYL